MSLNASGRLCVWAAALLATAAGLPALEGQDKGATQPTATRTPSPPPRMEDTLARSSAASQPGPEHRWLEPLIGSWKIEMTWYSPGAPTLRTSGTSENRWILGGRFVLAEAAAGEGPTAIEDKTLYGYDRWERKFFSLGLRTVGAGLTQDWGFYDPVSRSFALSGKDRDQATGRLGVHRQLIKVLGPDRYSIEVFADVPQRRPLKVLEIGFTRR